jgi:hypothetical protein
LEIQERREEERYILTMNNNDGIGGGLKKTLVLPKSDEKPLYKQ